ncbi:MAG: hypothetical protein JWO68_2286 [Actinomycetia bacterium]|nr:hypothetical protein [Actinomycetes bacterium]
MEHDPAEARHVAGTLVRLLLHHVEAEGGRAAVAAVCARAGDTRPIEALQRNETWSTYDQFRRLCEAIAEQGGGLYAVTQAAADVWGSGSHPELGSALQALGSADAVLGLLGQIAAAVEPLLDAESEQLAPADWRFRIRLVGGHQPFPAHCALVVGLISQVPVLFGQRAASVVEESCQVEGAPACTFRATWAAVGDPAEAHRAELELRERVLEARLVALQDSVGDLVSGQSVDVVLQRVVQAATQAVLARGVVLMVEPTPTGRRRVYWEGITPDEAEDCADLLLGGGHHETWTVIDIESRRGRYGRLAVVHELPTHAHHQRQALEAYGRVAAAALDSTLVLEEAARQADMATALLRLSLSLAEIGTTDEMAQRLVDAVPAVIDCDQVVIALHDAGAKLARIAALGGFSPELEQRYKGRAVPLHNLTDGHENVRVLAQGDDLAETDRRMLGASAALASVPLLAGGEVLGWVAVVVLDRPERLLEEPQLGDRLRGLAGQGATAMRNARLLDQIRYQAEHDPLTGLANQRLLSLHATEAIDRAKRDVSRVGLLFLDLDDFKDVNDNHGHAEGDQLLQLVGERLRLTLREGDTVARFGGDEFVVLLPSLTDDGSAVAAKIILALTDRFVVAGHDVRVTASIGRAVFPDDGDDFGELLKQADIRMYQAKLARRVGQDRRATT